MGENSFEIPNRQPINAAAASGGSASLTALEETMGLPKLAENYSEQEFEILLQQARKASDLLKAMSHESRLLILCLLSECERSVTALEDTLQMPQAAVSQQLARLRADGLVNTRRDGRTVYYSIASVEVSSIIGTLYDFFCAPVRKPE